MATEYPTPESILAAPMSPEVKALLRHAEQSDKRSLYERTSDNLKAGFKGANASGNRTVANALQLVDQTLEALDRIGEKIPGVRSIPGGPEDSPLKRAEKGFRGKSEELEKEATQLAAGDNSVSGKATRIIGALPVAVGEGAAALELGPIKGFAALEALRESDQGFWEALKGGAKGGILGGSFKFTEGMGRLPRAATVGATAATLAALEDADTEDIVLSALSTSVLAALGKPKEMKADPIVVRPSKPSPVEAPEIRAARFQEQEAPLFEVRDRHAEQVGQFLDTDLTRIEVGDKVLNLNLRRIDGPESLKQAETKLVELFEPQVEAARRGRVTHEQTAAYASELGMTVRELMARRKGQAFNAEELYAARTLTQSAMSELTQLAGRVRSGEASEIEMAEMVRLMSLVEGVTSQTLGATAEAGRALSALRMGAKAQNEQMAQIRELIQGYQGKTGMELHEFAERILTIPKGSARTRFVAEAGKATTSDKFLELWVNMLLSGPQTHAKNIISNFLFATQTIPETYLAGAIGGVRTKIPGASSERVYIAEGNARIKAMMPGLFGISNAGADGIRMARTAFETEVPGDLFLTKLEIRPKSIEGGMGKAIRIPGRSLLAADEFFKAMGYRQELYARAYRAAKEEGLKGNAFSERVQEIVNNPSQELKDLALKNARYQTFTNEVGAIGKAGQAIQRIHPAMRLLFPFVNTPTNIMGRGLERTPFAVLQKQFRDNIAEGGAVKDTALARATLGSSIMAWAAYQAAAGNIDGSGPTDPALRAVWRNAGHVPYSVKIGDMRYSFGGIEPFATVLGVGADFAELSGYMTDDEADDLAAKLALAVSKNLTSKTFVSGMAAAADALSDPERYGERLQQQLAGSTVPTFLAQVNRSEVDPYLRDINSNLDAIRSRTPGYSKDLPAVRNVWGEPVLLQGGWGPDLISPFYSNEINVDPVSQEAWRLKANLRRPDRKIGDVELEPKQFERMLSIGGRLAKKQLDLIVRGQFNADDSDLPESLKKTLRHSPAYERIPDAIKKDLFEEIYRGSMQVARNQILSELIQKDPNIIVAPILERLTKQSGGTH